jgi:outer membrane protein TolC
MREAEKAAQAMARAGQRTTLDVAAIRYARLEAELWLEMEKAKPKGQFDGRIEIQRMRVELAESALNARQERLAWSERMAQKGFASESQVTAAKADVKAAEIALAEAKLAFDALQAVPKEPAQPERKPGKE